jgi:GDP-L-fucose synthase
VQHYTRAIGKVIGYAGEIRFDPSKPHGPPPKRMNSTRLNSLGCSARIGLEEGLRLAYDDFLLL